MTMISLSGLDLGFLYNEHPPQKRKPGRKRKVK